MSDVFLIRYKRGHQTGLALDSGERAYALDDASVALDAPLSTLPVDHLVGTLEETKAAPIDLADPAVSLLAPVGRFQEVWAAGVTYKRSEEARESESHNSTVYSRVYSAKRPELFFKALGQDVIAPGGQVGIRYDATWSVPEPELAVVLNARLEVVGFTIGNDMSSRDIEGENPLYLPQAKVYRGACALGPRIWLQPGRTDWPQLTIQMTIRRTGQIAFEAKTSTANLHRPLPELIDYLGRCKDFPRGALLFTGTGIVPPDDFTLHAGDEIRIGIDPIGELVNTVGVVGGTLTPSIPLSAS
ncbi:MAG: fumarylacetoacetate hydrolase family protein [Aggregatilineales bacterium]